MAAAGPSAKPRSTLALTRDTNSAERRFRPKGGKDKGDKPQKAAAPATAEPRKAKTESLQQVYLLGPERKPVAVPIKTGVANDGQVELVEGNLRENDEVIVEQLSPQKKSGGAGGMPMGPRF